MKVIKQYLEENAYNTFISAYLKRLPKKGLYNAISEWRKKKRIDKKYAEAEAKKADKKADKLKKKKKESKKKEKKK